MIKKIVDKNCQSIFRYPILYLLALLILTAVTGYYYATLTTETSLESLIFKNDPDLIFYKKFKEQFGENETLIVGFSAANVFTPKALNYISIQTKKLKNLEDVDEVISLSNVEHVIGSDNDFLVQKLFDEAPDTHEEIERVRKYAQESSLIGGSLVSRDSQATLFVIRPLHGPENPEADARLVKQVKKIFDEGQNQYPEFKPHYAGGVIIRNSMSQATNHDMFTFMPLTYLLLIILTTIFLRNRWLVILSIINVSVCLILTLGVLNLIGGAMSPMTSILPPLIMALAVSDSIHIFTEFLSQDRTHQSLPTIMSQTLQTLAVPCFLTSLTTAVGFLSLGISDIPPIKHLGFASSIGMMAEFALSITIIPLGICFLKNKNSLKTKPVTENSLFHNQLVLFARQLQKHSGSILSCSIFLIILSIVAASHIKVETDLIEFFKKNTKTYQDNLFTDKYLGGTEILEVSIQAINSDQLLDPEVLESLGKIENFLRGQKIVSNVSSLNNFFREMNKAFHNSDPKWLKIPSSHNLASQYLLLYGGKDIENVLDPANQWTHISARINVHNSKKITKLIDELRAYIQDNFSHLPIAIRLTGQTLLSNKLIDYIVNSQIESLAMALVLIFIIMLCIFKSIKLGIISLIPNILPILFNFAIMGALGIPLNSATAIIAAVAIGIAVDDTIHFLHSYQESKQLHLSTENALRHALTQKGVPLITTSLILAGSFSILLLGSFIPTIQFGLLVSLIMLSALLSDLLILPCLLLKLENGTHKKHQK